MAHRRTIIGAAIAGAAGLALVGLQWNSRPGTASDQPPLSLPSDLTIDDGGRVVEVIDGDTVALADGRQVRLVGTQAPKLALGRRNFTDWPLSTESRLALLEMVDGQNVELAFGGLREDRHGRTLAHLVSDDIGWIQGAMLQAGMTRVYTFSDNRGGIAPMLELEREARANNRGIWDHPYYAVRDPGGLDDLIGQFELVEGRVLNAADARIGTYLNFGRDWSQDFTVLVRRDDRRNFDASGMDLLDLESRQIRVRGWLVERDGPLIEVTHPEQIEVL